MKKFSLALLAVFFGLLNVSFAQKSDLEKFLKIIEKTWKEWDMPGFAIAVVQDGKIVFEKGYGYLNWDKKAKANENTLYPVGSISKSFTALAIAQLVDEGKLNWKDKVKKYIPELKLYDKYVSEHITIEDLLCHRAGYKTFSGDLLWFWTSYSVNDIIKKLKYLKPAYEFRDGFGYSNLMFLLAGEVIERVSGQKWENYVKQNIFTPLKMKRTNTDVAVLKTDGNFAYGCVVTKDGEHITIPYIPSHNIGAFGGINSSVHDLANYMIMLLNNGTFDGKPIVSAKALDNLWQVHNPLKVSDFYRQRFNRHFYGYGLGWFLFDKNGYKIIKHSGGMEGALSNLVLIPEKNTGMVILTNSDNMFFEAAVDYFLDVFTGSKEIPDWNDFYLRYYDYKFRSYWQMKNRHKPDFSKSPSLKLAEYQGTYTDTMYGDVEIKLINDTAFSVHFVPAPFLDATMTRWNGDTLQLHFKNYMMSIPTQWGLAKFDVKNGKITGLKFDVPNYDFHFDEFYFRKKQ